ncbi:YhcN/YlaJ family sporulation lipoprotein [Lederbergia citrea]|uniref:YhcN/YlaJ family sporulation lipoprotein n=1 Tax=Lederbergia citrea TaxID=2833581 RepID=A0A942ULK4_9BACI|nr:YhcN/YlaJ family sporulation lipoprotein [Lederbergia citrea]MBS4177260.1 YhcN/YlaJ family sporulation lipoprotein [Lederbergia citrea]MBS4203923.1 YhcN/YlaJ family sporulation lipoprotein [Lederbergia citrea]MBS4221492.1 YhcN/YlaJ family sporulation lipoprotein [Lederbergia citrea]
MRNALFLLLFLLLMSACQQKNTQHQNNMDVMPQGVSVKDSHIDVRDRSDMVDEQRAQYLADLAGDIPNVRNATGLVIGNIAIVGIDVDPNVDRSKVGTIKYAVSESLRHDPQGVGAMVVADPDVNARLIEMRREISAGKPIQGIMNELSAMIGRLMPDVPLPENGKNPQNATERPKDEMNRSNDRELEMEQKDQSNQQK